MSATRALYDQFSVLPDQRAGLRCLALVQQLALAAGVALAAVLLKTSRSADARNQWLALDFGRAYVGVGRLSLLSLAAYLRLAALVAASR